MLVMGNASVWAEEVTFSMETKWSSQTNTISPITVEFNSSAGLQTGYVKVVKGNAFTISTTGSYKITAISITATGTDYNTKDGAVSANAGSINHTEENPTTTWSGSAQTITITNGATGGDWRISNITVTYSAADGGKTVDDLVQITSNYTYTPTATIPDKSLTDDGKVFGVGGNSYTSSMGVLVKNAQRYLAIKVVQGATVTVEGYCNGSTNERKLYMGSTAGGYEYKQSGTITTGNTESISYTFDNDATVYISANGYDLYVKSITVSYKVPVTDITLNKNKLYLEYEKHETLSATINPDDASNKNIIWSSSNTENATVNATTGEVYGKNNYGGTATVTATAADGNGASASCDVYVYRFSETSSSSKEFTKGQDVSGVHPQIYTVFTEEGGNLVLNQSDFSVTSSNSNIITGSIRSIQDGNKVVLNLALGTEVGQATLTLTYNGSNTNYNGKSYVINYTVKAPAIGNTDCTDAWGANVTSEAVALTNGKTVKFSFTNHNGNKGAAWNNWNLVSGTNASKPENGNSTALRSDAWYWGNGQSGIHTSMSGDWSTVNQANMDGAHIDVMVSRINDNVVTYYVIMTLNDGKKAMMDLSQNYSASPTPTYAWLRVDNSYITDLVVSTSDITYRTVTTTKNDSDGGNVVAKVKDTNTDLTDNKVVDGTTVKFTATPADWYMFENWHDGTAYVGDNTGIYERSITSNTSIQANFARYYKINVVANNAAYGDVTLTGGTVNEAIKKGTNITLTANPNAGYRFVKWTVGSTDKSTDISFSNKIENIISEVGNDKEIITITAVFEPSVTTHTITFNANGGTGTMTPQVIEESVPTAITPNQFSRPYYSFVNWNTKSDGTGTSYVNSASITLTSDITLYAQWTKESYTCNVTVNNSSWGTATVNGSKTSASVEYNSKAEYVATPNTGYRFINWTENGTEVSTSLKYTITVDADRTLRANFELKPKEVTTKNITWDLKNCGNTGSKTETNAALYWNTQAGNVVDSGDDTNKLNGLKINSISDTYFVIPAEVKGLLTITYGARYPNLETSIAVTGQSPVYTTDKASTVDFNIENTTGANQEIHITRGTSTSREGVITQIIWTPQQASNLKGKTIEMLYGHEYVNTANISTGYTTSSKGALTYTSNNTDIVTVDANGVLTAHKAGIATVTVSQAETYGYKAKVVSVTVNVNDLYASSNSLEVQKDNNKTVTLSSSSTGAYTVTSANTGIATASVSGDIVTITGVADGETIITVEQAAITGYPKATITIDVSVYTTKAYYDATNGNLKFEKDIIEGKNYMKLGGVGFSKRSYNYEGVNQSDKEIYDIKTTGHVMKINVKNAAAFEVFTVGNKGRTYYMNVDGKNVGVVAAESGTTSSGVFPCEKAGSTITLTGSGNDVYPAYIKFYEVLPTIIKVDGRSGFDNVTRFVDGGAVSFPVATNNSTSEMTLTGVDPQIATVTYSDNNLTITPVKAGSFTMTLAQAAVGSEQTAGSREIKVDIKKHNITFTYDKPIISIDKNTNPSATLTDVATLSCTVDGVATALNNLPDGVTVTYDSDDHNVATVADNGTVSLAPNPQGTAAITASIANNATYEATNGQHKIAVIDGYNFKMNVAGTKSAIGQSYPIYDGEEIDENKLVNIYYGGWKYGDHSYAGVDNADSWPNSKIYSRAGSAEKIYIDDYQQQTQANNDARTENKTTFEIGKPFSLPVRGAYMKFDAERTGVLTAYFVQNGDLNYEGEVLKSGSDIARRPYFITDELGQIVTPISAMSKEKLPSQSDVTSISCGGNPSAPNYLAALADKELTPEGKLVNWTWSTDTRQPVLYDEVTHGYHVLQKAYVKYVFNVEAGKSYYVFSSASKIGFAGANFQADDDSKLNAKDIAHEGKLELDQTKTYVAPTKKTWYDVATLNRSFKAGEWSTIILPFSICESKVKEIFGEGTQLTVFNGVDGSTVHFFYHVDQNIIAGYPYIIRPGKDVESIEVNNVTVDPKVPQFVFSNENEGGHGKLDLAGNTAWVPGGDYVFKGLDGYSKSDDKETMAKYSYYVSSDGLHRTTTGTLTTNGYRAYLKYVGKTSAGATAPAKFTLTSVYGIEDAYDDYTSTEIMMALNAEDMLAPATYKGVYNLNGQKVAESTKNLTPGIYVVNGKKIVINK